MSADFLTCMAQASRERTLQARARCPEATLRARALATRAAPRLSPSDQGFDLIAEVKLRSPALGPLSDAPASGPEGVDEAITARVRSYADAGAAVVSVLTEPTRFDGALAHLEQAARALSGRIPAMRKDFLVDPYQVYEARAAGAGGVLLILRMLDRTQQCALIEAAGEMGLFVLLEAFDQIDLEQAERLAQRYRDEVTLLAGVNCRDLSTLEVVPDRLEALGPHLPGDLPCVAESGLGCAEDAARAARAGYRWALVGGALMRSAAPDRLIEALLAAGRAARGAQASRAACR